MSTPHVTIGGVDISMQPRAPEPPGAPNTTEVSRFTDNMHPSIRVTVDSPQSKRAPRSPQQELWWAAGAFACLGLIIVLAVLLARRRTRPS